MARYREKKTGRFASKNNWERSHGPTGKYVREYEREEEEDDGGDVGEQEWVASASYQPGGRNRGTSAVSVQLHIFAPGDWTRDRVKQAFDSWRQEYNEIEDLAAYGLRADVITWEHRKGEGSGDASEEWEQFNRIPLEFSIEESK